MTKKVLLSTIILLVLLSLGEAVGEEEAAIIRPALLVSTPATVVMASRTYLSPTKTPTPTPTPTPTATPTPTPTPTPLYKEKMPAGIYPHVQCIPSTPVPQMHAVKVFACEQATLWPRDTFVVLRLYNTEGGVLDPNIPEEEVARVWLETLDNAIDRCKEFIDAVEVFNEVCGDGDLEKSRRVARVSYLIAKGLVERRLRPIVLNYPVSTPLRQEVMLPEMRKLIDYINRVDGYVGIHIYFPCHHPDFWASWIFADSFRGVPVKFVATEVGVCNLNNPWGWNPYSGWKDCERMTQEDYKRELSRLPEIARRKGIDLTTFFVFTIAHPGQGWGSFQSDSLFNLTCQQ